MFNCHSLHCCPEFRCASHDATGMILSLYTSLAHPPPPPIHGSAGQLPGSLWAGSVGWDCKRGVGGAGDPKIALRGGRALGQPPSVPAPLFYVYFGDNCWHQRRRNFFFFGPPEGEFFSVYLICFPSNHSEFCGEFKNG